MYQQSVAACSAILASCSMCGVFGQQLGLVPVGILAGSSVQLARVRLQRRAMWNTSHEYGASLQDSAGARALGALCINSAPLRSGAACRLLVCLGNSEGTYLALQLGPLVAVLCCRRGRWRASPHAKLGLELKVRAWCCSAVAAVLSW